MCGFTTPHTVSVSVSHIYSLLLSSLCLNADCNSLLAHKLTSPPAALSLETPARWSFSLLFISSHPPSNLPLSSLVPLSLPTFSSSSPSSFQHPPYPPLSTSLSLFLSVTLTLSVGISLADAVHWEPVIVCGWEQRRRVEPITAMQSNQTTSECCSRRCVFACALVCTVCVHI